MLIELGNHSLVFCSKLSQEEYSVFWTLPNQDGQGVVGPIEEVQRAIQKLKLGKEVEENLLCTITCLPLLGEIQDFKEGVTLHDN